MSYRAIHHRKFEKDAQKFLKSGNTSAQKKFQLIYKLILSQSESDQLLLRQQFQDHALKGYYEGCRELHILDDLLLIYEVNHLNRQVLFQRLGSHSDVF